MKFASASFIHTVRFSDKKPRVKHKAATLGLGTDRQTSKLRCCTVQPIPLLQPPGTSISSPPLRPSFSSPSLSLPSSPLSYPPSCACLFLALFPPSTHPNRFAFPTSHPLFPFPYLLSHCSTPPLNPHPAPALCPSVRLPSVPVPSPGAYLCPPRFPFPRTNPLRSSPPALHTALPAGSGCNKCRARPGDPDLPAAPGGCLQRASHLDMVPANYPPCHLLLITCHWPEQRLPAKTHRVIVDLHLLGSSLPGSVSGRALP